MNASVPILETAKTCLRQILESSTPTITDLCIRQIIQVGLQTVDILVSCLDVHQLARGIAQYFGRLCESRKSISEVDTDLESDIAEFLLKIGAKVVERHVEESPAEIRSCAASKDVSGATAPENRIFGPFSISETSQAFIYQLFSISVILKTIRSFLDDGECDGSDNPSVLFLLNEEITSLRDAFLDLFKKSRGHNLEILLPLIADMMDVQVIIESRAKASAGYGSTSDENTSPSLRADAYPILLTKYRVVFEITVDGLVDSASGSPNPATSSLLENALLLQKRLQLLRHLQQAHELLAVLEATGQGQDPSKAISIFQSAPIHTASDDLLGRSAVADLGNAFFLRYSTNGDYSDVTEGISVLSSLVLDNPDKLPLEDQHPWRVRSLVSFSALLLCRYWQHRSLSDLQEATRCAREALKLCQPGHPLRVSALQNLSSCLLERYEDEPHQSDLSNAIKYLREAIKLTPSASFKRMYIGHLLASALTALDAYGGGMSRRFEEIQYCRETLELMPPDHQQRIPVLDALASALLERYKRQDDVDGNQQLSDLSEAIFYYRELAEKFTSLAHPFPIQMQATAFCNLGSALLKRYREEGNTNSYDLSEAVECGQKALEILPPDDPVRQVCHSLLTVIKLLKALNCGSDTDAMLANFEILHIIRDFATRPSEKPHRALEATLAWISACIVLDFPVMLDTYQAALEKLDIVLLSGHTLADKRAQFQGYSFKECKNLSILAASCALRDGHTQLAVELLEQGRNLLFNQIGRYRVGLEKLRNANPRLAEQFFKLCRLLDASVLESEADVGMGSPSEDLNERYRRMSSDWKQAVEDIRNEEGFEDFLKPPKYAKLQAAAAHGPIIVLVPDEVEDQTHALIVQENSAPYHLPLPDAKQKTMRKLLSKLLDGAQSDQQWEADEIFTYVLRRLWDVVVGPIVDTLENVIHVPLHSRIWWCPAGILSTLPFHAAGHYSHGNPDLSLPDKYTSSYTPTLQALLRAQRDRNVIGRQKMLIVAQPDTPGQIHLPGVLLEAEHVKMLAQSKLDTTVLSSEKGTRSAVLSAMAGHSWLHLMCQGHQDFGEPFDSGFALHDERLSLRNIMKGDLPQAEFAFLAACHTATGDPNLLDEGLHLAAGLQFAGFRSVVGTIWEVADEDGPIIAEAFYKALEAGGPEGRWDPSRAAYALSEAVKHLRDTEVPINRWVRYIHIGI